MPSTSPRESVSSTCQQKLEIETSVHNLAEVNCTFPSDLDPSSISTSSLYTSPPASQPSTTPAATSAATNHLSKSVIRGFRAPSSPRTCRVSFEGPPVWLWSLRRIDWTTIAMTHECKGRLQRDYEATYLAFQDKIMTTDHLLSVPASVWFASGSTRFLAQFFHISDMPIVRLVLGEGRRPKSILKSSHMQWLSLPHTRVGGSTTCRAILGFSGLPHLTFPQDLHRTIGHGIKYSIRPRPCSPNLEEPHLVTSSLLPVSRIRMPVLYPTHFSHTGWGIRSLTDPELAGIFELPPYLDWSDSLASDIVPLQIPRAVIDSVVPLLPSSGTENVVPSCPSPVNTNPVLSSDTEEWLDGLQRRLPGTWTDTSIADHAVKDDGAQVDFSPWHQRIRLVLPCKESDLAIIERFAMRRWRRNIVHSFFAYISITYGSQWLQELGPTLDQHRQQRSRASAKRGVWDNADTSIDLVQDLKKGLQVLGQVLQSTWWEWSHGSSLFFWRWNGRSQIQAARDGMNIFVSSPLRPRPMKPIKFKPEDAILVAEKVNGMLAKNYLDANKYVRTGLHYFAVPKGETDIRVVFDGTSSGLNESLWAPNFFLPTARDAGQLLSFSTFMADVDFGEMFHNFFMDPKVRKHAGVEIGILRDHSKDKNGGRRSGGKSMKPAPSFVRWNRLFMGMRPSPYNAVRYYFWGEEFARGNRSLPTNPMGYDQVRLNLPGMPDYDPSLPKVMKWNTLTQSIAGDVIT